MTGTLLPNFWELRKVYRLWTTHVPTNRPSHPRAMLPDAVFPTEDAKFDAVVQQDAARCWRAGRPVLIGTRSVEKSKKLSAKLTAAGDRRTRCSTPSRTSTRPRSSPQAGQPGTVTVATNMAGRGTDIKLGPGVAEAGGLHVIGTERHEASRIDRQLIGRAGRQGDPGSGQFMPRWRTSCSKASAPRAQRELDELGRAGGNRDWNQYAPLFRWPSRRSSGSTTASGST